MDFLNSKERKLFYKRLVEQYGYSGPREVALFRGGADKIYAVSKDLDLVPFMDLRPVQGGLYVASTQADDLRLTLDGALLFGPHCEGCFVELTREEKDVWMAGEDLPYSGSLRGFVLVCYEQRILGCGSVASQGYIKNYVPKGRRISDPH